MSNGKCQMSNGKWLGVLAQLVERNVRNVEVRGSTPLCSTKREGVSKLLTHPLCNE